MKDNGVKLPEEDKDSVGEEVNIDKLYFNYIYGSYLRQYYLLPMSCESQMFENKMRKGKKINIINDQRLDKERIVHTDVDCDKDRGEIDCI